MSVFEKGNAFVKKATDQGAKFVDVVKEKAPSVGQQFVDWTKKNKQLAIGSIVAGIVLAIVYKTGVRNGRKQKK